MDYKVIDDFLDKKEFEILKQTVLSHDFPWFMSHGVTSYDNNSEHYMLSHKFYENFKINSSSFTLLDNLLSKLGIKAVIRIKANLYPKTSEIIEHDFHTDYDFKHKTALLMLNTNNGFTILNDGTKIGTVENRLLTFDASEKHASTTCTDEKYKVNLVVNYF